MTSPTAADYTTVTEVPGNRVRGEALARLDMRYSYAARLCGAREVLEVACGAGMGLGRLAAAARRVGADHSWAFPDNRRTLQGRGRLIRAWLSSRITRTER